MNIQNLIKTSVSTPLAAVAASALLAIGLSLTARAADTPVFKADIYNTAGHVQSGWTGLLPTNSGGPWTSNFPNVGGSGITVDLSAGGGNSGTRARSLPTVGIIDGVNLNTMYYDMVFAAGGFDIKLTGLTPGATYKFKLYSWDVPNGNVADINWKYSLAGNKSSPVDAGWVNQPNSPASVKYNTGILLAEKGIAALSTTFTATGTSVDFFSIGTVVVLDGFELYQVIPVTNTAVDGNCTVAASPASVTADGVSTSTVTVTLNDSGPLPVAYKTVTLARNGGTGGGTPTITTQGSGMTNALGVATFAVKCSTAGDYEFQATDVTDSNLAISQKATVTFTAVATVDASTSTVTASPTSVSADGVTTSTVTVTLLTNASAPVAGKTVTLARNGNTGAGTPTVTTLSATTDLSGQATFTVKCTTAGLYDFEATDSTDSLTVSTKSTVTFTAAPAHAGNSTATASPTTVTANGTNSSTVTVTLKDLGSHVVPGKTVTLASSRAVDTITPTSGISDGAGVVTFTVTSTTLTLGTAAVFTATDTDDSVTVTQKPTVNFVAPPPNAGNSTVLASPTSVPADGTTTSTVTVTLLDGATPIEYKTVTLAKTSGSGTVIITTVSGTTNASGVATFTVKCSTANAGEYVFTATDTSDTVILTQTATVTFTVPPLVANAGADAYITGTSVQIGANPAATGGVLPYTYTWSPSEGLSATNVANPTATAVGTYTLTVKDAANTEVTDTVVVALGANPNLVSVDCVYAGAGYSPSTGDTVTTGTLINNAAGAIYTGQVGAWNALNMGTDNTNTGSASRINLVTGAGNATTVAFKLGAATSLGAAGGNWRNNGVTGLTAGKLRQEGPYLYYPTLTANHFNWELTGLTANAHYRLTLFGNGGSSYTNIANSVAGVMDTEGDWNWADIQASATGVITGNLLTTGNNQTNSLYGMQIEGTMPSLPALVANAGADQSYTDTPVAIGGSPTASGGTGSGYTYSWSPATGLSSATTANPTAAPATTTTYTVTINDGLSTAATDSVIVTVGAATPPYQTWADANAGGQAADLDSNHDGVQNGIAYFMGMNGLATLPGVVGGKVTWPHVGVVSAFEVQVSTNLIDWSAAPSGVDTSDPSKVVYTLPVGASLTFCRLSVAP